MKKKKSLAHLVSVSLTPEKEMNSKIMWSVFLALSHKLVSLNKAKIPGVYNSKERSLYIISTVNVLSCIDLDKGEAQR